MTDNDAVRVHLDSSGDLGLTLEKLLGVVLPCCHCEDTQHHHSNSRNAAPKHMASALRNYVNSEPILLSRVRYR